MNVGGIGGVTSASWLLGASPPKPEGLEEEMPSPLEMMDADGDGQVGAEEFMGSEEAFTEGDADGDGYLSESELMAMAPNRGAMGSPPEMSGGEMSAEEMVASILANDDADQDGYISEEEYKGPEGLFSELDSDGDGLLSEAELTTMAENRPAQGPPPGGGPPPEMTTGDIAASTIEALDSDGDGGLSASESQASAQIFDAMDTNQDGIVSQAELEAALVTVQTAMANGELELNAQGAMSASGFAAYQEEMERMVLEVLTGGSSDTEDSETTTATSETQSVEITV